MIPTLRASVVVTALTVLLLGGAYPALVTGIAQVVFPSRSRGSLVERDVERHAEGRTPWILGEPRVNVLELNLALDAAR